MTDRPIIFSAPMIRALLDGRKSQTRRILKPQPPAQPQAYCHPDHQPRHAAPYLDAYCGEPCTKENPRGMSRNWHWWQVDDRPGLVACRAPCVPGDRLWVREGLVCATENMGEFASFADVVCYAEDGSTALRECQMVNWPWKRETLNARFMPRWASRLTLIVTDVRVQRLWDIIEADAVAEGARSSGENWQEGPPRIAARANFKNIWAGIHGHDAWDANPWVAAISFKTHKCNIDKMPGGDHE